MTEIDPSVLSILDLIGVFVFALSGASLGARRAFDVVGIAVLATATGLGGGIVRDALLGDLPPVALRDQLYLATTLLAGGVVVVGLTLVERMSRPVLMFDAAGLGLFAVVGTVKALEFGLEPMPSILLGTTTAVGGGVLRDVLAREIPAIFTAGSSLYAVPAALGASMTTVLWTHELLTSLTASLAAFTAVALRVIAVTKGWSAPTARSSSD